MFWMKARSMTGLSFFLPMSYSRSRELITEGRIWSLLVIIRYFKKKSNKPF